MRLDSAGTGPGRAGTRLRAASVYDQTRPRPRPAGHGHPRQLDLFLRRRRQGKPVRFPQTGRGSRNLVHAGIGPKGQPCQQRRIRHREESRGFLPPAVHQCGKGRLPHRMDVLRGKCHPPGQHLHQRAGADHPPGQLPRMGRCGLHAHLRLAQFSDRPRPALPVGVFGHQTDHPGRYQRFLREPVCGHEIPHPRPFRRERGAPPPEGYPGAGHLPVRYRLYPGRLCARR